MNPIVANLEQASFWTESIPLYWIWGALSLLTSATLSFYAGMSYARFQDRNLGERTKKNLKLLFGAVTSTLDQARDLCGSLYDLPGSVNEEQIETLESKKQGVLDQLDRVLQRYRQANTPPEPQTPPVCGLEKSAFAWQRAPEDRITGLPGMEAFEQNLQTLLNWCRDYKRPGGLLLVRIDRFDSLRERYGVAGSQLLVKRMSQLLYRAVREIDVTCQLAAHTFGILLQDLSPEGCERIVSVIRNSISNSRFRTDESSPEILMTASLGFTSLCESDSGDLSLSRAQVALERSERVGRNQLHIHDGSALVHVTAS